MKEVGSQQFLPAGVNWEDSPLFDFPRSPRLSLFPDLCRLLQVGWLSLQYSGVLDGPQHIRLLDVASGFGELLRILRSQRLAKGARIQYIGLDIDDRKVKRAREMMPKGDFRIGMIQDILTLFDSKFDVIASTETLEHVEKDDGIKFLSDCYQLLNPGGHLILTCATPHLHRENHWHLHEWEDKELEEVIANQPWIIKDHFFMKAPVRAIGKDKMPKLAKRVPNEMIRGVLSAQADTGSQQVWVLSKTPHDKSDYDC